MQADDTHGRSVAQRLPYHGDGAAIRQIAFGSPAYEAALRFREEHLRRPLGLGLSAEDLAGEAEQIHIAAFEADALVGTVLLKPASATVVRLRQMAVAQHRRRTGLGSDLVRFAEQVAVEHAFSTIQLNARAAVEPFYAALGYRRVGEVVIHMNIPHVIMSRQIPG